MKKSLIVAGTVYTILCLCSIGAHINIISGVLSAALNLFVFGTLFYVVHELLGKIEKLEKKLEKDLYVKKTSIERKKCPKCGKSVDADYTSCPHCGLSFRDL